MNEFIRGINNTLILMNDIEKRFFISSLQNMELIKRTIDKSDDFFNSFFYNKTREEIFSWIEDEALEW